MGSTRVVPWYHLGDMVSFSGTMVPLNDTMVVPHYYHGTWYFTMVVPELYHGII